MSRWLGVRVGGLALAAIAGCAADDSTHMKGEAMRVADRFNPMITLQEQGLPVFGLYAPRARQRGGSPPDGLDVKTPTQLAEEMTAYERSDYVFGYIRISQRA